MKKLILFIAIAVVAAACEKKPKNAIVTPAPVTTPDTTYCIQRTTTDQNNVVTYHYVACEPNRPGPYAQDVSYYHNKYSQYTNLVISVKHHCNDCPQ